MIDHNIEFYAYLPKIWIFFLHFGLRSDPHFFQSDPDPHFLSSRIRVRGKKCWILIPVKITIFFHLSGVRRDHKQGQRWLPKGMKTQIILSTYWIKQMSDYQVLIFQNSPVRKFVEFITQKHAILELFIPLLMQFSPSFLSYF